MKEKTFKRKTILYIIIALVVLVTAIPLSYALYLNQAGKKGIITTSSTEARFSSNILKQYPHASAVGNRFEKSYVLNFFGKEESEYLINFNVTNAHVANKTLINNQDIVYDVLITLVLDESVEFDAENRPKISVNEQEFVDITSTSFTFPNQTLAYGVAVSKNDYRFKFPAYMLDNATVIIEARPQEQYFDATLKTVLYREFLLTNTNNEYVYDFLCTGKFSDKKEEELSTDYRGFNYVISVQNGSGTATLRWNTDYLLIDQGFLDDVYEEQSVSPIDEGNGISSLTIAVNSNVNNKYDIYFTRNNAIPSESWELVEGLVTLTAVQD